MKFSAVIAIAVAVVAVASLVAVEASPVLDRRGPPPPIHWKDKTYEMHFENGKGCMFSNGPGWISPSDIGPVQKETLSSKAIIHSNHTYTNPL
ncbi:hypothetical protein BDF22DRAFT_685685 [Syncephalis plumigaleata]|nr:hypothetical protein BDF22DRAFT_685685 [Syncephalis plumigaleata]